MATVTNGKRVLTVEASTVNTYLKQGYDQVELAKDGKSYDVVRRATGGRTVTYAEYVATLERAEAAEKEVKALKAEITKLKKADA